MILLITSTVSFISLIIMLFVLRYHLYNDGQLYISNKLIVSGAIGVTYILLVKNHYESYQLYIHLFSVIVSLLVILFTPILKNHHQFRHRNSLYLFLITILFMIGLDVYFSYSLLVILPLLILGISFIIQPKFHQIIWLFCILIYVSLQFIVPYFLDENSLSTYYIPTWVVFFITIQSLLLRNKIFIDEIK